MKQLFFLSLILLSASVMESWGQAQAPKSPTITAEGENVSIVYGQPSKRGRVIFGELVPYGKIWRTGANEATEITFKKDAVFGGKKIKAGTYTLFTIPTKSDWTVVLNSELKQWGAFKYDEIKDKDVLKVTVPSSRIDEPVEKLTLRFDDKNSLIIEWDTTRVTVPVKI